MNSKLKKFGFVMIAALVLSLAIASGASAAQFTASSYPAKYEGFGKVGDGIVSTEAGKIQCAAAVSGTLSEASSTLTVSAVFTSCNAFGFLEATVNSSGCDYLVHVSSGSADSYAGSGDLVCETGKKILVTASTCKLEFAAQTGAASFKYTNNTAQGRVEGDVTSSNVAYTVTQDGLFCPFKGTGGKTGGEVSQALPTEFTVPGNPVVID